ncbi:hypothetical protein TNIN_254561 [Trichonephila inaurata madagascariensis]|uniref:Uncharacterized protein n=1 Tax=Trichonephila inaurata madagascariensis TaxID=2747483 RepID=A0A8X6Y131_9ARAC|nr:hypothetical protein TNIN_254561 [Trichonephila inaurata madagascariensis]
MRKSLMRQGGEQRPLKRYGRTGEAVSAEFLALDNERKPFKRTRFKSPEDHGAEYSHSYRSVVLKLCSSFYSTNQTPLIGG